MGNSENYKNLWNTRRKPEDGIWKCSGASMPRGTRETAVTPHLCEKDGMNSKSGQKDHHQH